MKKLTLTKETIRDLSKPELDGVAGATGPVCNFSSPCGSFEASNCNTCQATCDVA